MLFSKEEFKNCIELREKFESAVEKVLVKKLNIEGKSLYTGEITSIELECERLEITVTEYSRCSCCSDTHHYYSFPESYLYTDWESGNKKEVEAKEKLECKKREDKEKEKKGEQKRQEYEEYMKLKAKFEEA